jgi:formylglycine-generating enzyme required for sulfatase activity
MDVRRGLAVVPALAILAGIGLVVMGVRGAPLPDIEPRPSKPMLPIAAKDGVAAFQMDAQEVSVAEYAACVRANACTLHVTAASPSSTLRSRHEDSSRCLGGRPDRWESTMNCVDYRDATAYCKWAGKRLLTLAEWQLGVGSKHPEGGWDLHRLQDGDGYFAGEWTSTAGVTTKGRPAHDSLRAIGAWRADMARRFQLYAASPEPQLTRSHTIGFRCAK